MNRKAKFGQKIDIFQSRQKLLILPVHFTHTLASLRFARLAAARGHLFHWLVTGVSCALDWLLNLQELHCTCLRVLDYQDYVLSVGFLCFFPLAISLTVAFVSCSCFLFLFSCLAVSGSLVAYVSCHFASSCDAVPGSCIVYFSCCFAGSLDAIKGSPAAAYFSCHFKSSCVAIAGSLTANFARWCSLLRSDSWEVYWELFCVIICF